LVIKTIGVGGDYTDFNLAVLALQALGVGGIVEDYEFRIISSFNNITASPVGFVCPNGFTISFINENPPLGNPLNGHKITCATTPYIRTYADVQGRGELIFDGLYLKENGVGLSLLTIVIPQETFAYAQWKDRKTVIKNCMFDAGKNVQIALNCRSAEYSLWELSNLKIWGHTALGLVFENAGVVQNPGETTKFIENITVFNEVNNCVGIRSNVAGDAGSDDTRYSNVVVANDGIAVGTVCWDSGILPGRIIVNNCASSDATCPLVYGTGNIRNIVPANEFKSLDDTNSDFLELKETADFSGVPLSVDIGDTVSLNSFLSGTGQLYQTGTTTISAWNTEDIAGNQRPDADGKVSIGAHEQTEISSYSWNFDDGKSSVSKNPSVFYTTPGFKTISLTLVYKDGSTETVTKVDYIEVRGYNIGFIGNPTSGPAPLKVKFETTFEPL